MLPQIAVKLRAINIHPLMYATPWFMCLFSALPCWDTVLSICDGFMLLGECSMKYFTTDTHAFSGTPFLHGSAIAILKSSEKALLEMDSITDVLPYLQRLPVSKVYL